MDLIVVGMRFQSAYKYGSVAKGDKLLVMIEPSNSVNKNALAVYNIRGGIGVRGDKIGYIRDADLNMAHKELFSKLSTNGYTPDSRVLFEVTKVQANYICISYVDNLRLGSPALQDEEKVRKELEALKAAKEAALASFNSSPIVNTSAVSGVAYVGLSVNSSAIATTTSNQFTIKKEEPKMTFNTSNLKDSFFREVKNVAFDLQSGKLGVTSKDGISVYTADGVSVNPITEMGFAMPAFAMRVPVADLKEGDILIGNGDPVFFKEFNKTGGGYKTVSLNGAVQEVGNVTNLFFGKNSVLAVKNMFGDSSGGMNPMMLMAMSGALGGGDSKIDPIMLMAMSGGMGGGDSMGGMNPMMFALMLSKK